MYSLGALFLDREENIFPNLSAAVAATLEASHSWLCELTIGQGHLGIHPLYRDGTHSSPEHVACQFSQNSPESYFWLAFPLEDPDCPSCHQHPASYLTILHRYLISSLLHTLFWVLCSSLIDTSNRNINTDLLLTQHKAHHTYSSAAVLCPVPQLCLFVTPWTVAYRAALSTEFIYHEGYWSRLPFPPPGESSWPRDQTSPMSLVLQADSLPLSHGGNIYSSTTYKIISSKCLSEKLQTNLASFLSIAIHHLPSLAGLVHSYSQRSVVDPLPFHASCHHSLLTFA